MYWDSDVGPNPVSSVDAVFVNQTAAGRQVDRYLVDRQNPALGGFYFVVDEYLPLDILKKVSNGRH